MAARRRRKRSPRPDPDLAAERRLFDRGIVHRILIERFIAGEIDSLAAIWDEGLEDAATTVLRLGRLKGRGMGVRPRGPWDTVLYAEALARIADILQGTTVAFRNAVRQSMLELGRAEIAWQRKAVQESLGFSFDLPPTNIARAALVASPIEGRHLADWTDGLSKTAQTKIRTEVNRALMRGDNLDDLVRQIREITSKTLEHARAIARTALSHASSAGRESLFQANSDVVIGVLWVSTLDARTTDQCAALDGTVHRLSEGPRPPAHVNCRSDVAPLTRSTASILAGETGPPTDEQLLEARDRRQGKRAAYDYASGTNAPASINERFPQWLQKQPATVQDQVLGRDRARLWRAGKIKIEQFLTRDYRVLTLTELIRREGLTAADLRAVGIRNVGRYLRAA